MQALDPIHHLAFATCYLADPCDADQARTCLDGLACDSELLIGSHCDALARCGMDGRGWLSEEDCRAAPYSEPQQWACLTADRRTAIGACLESQQCGDLEVCVRAAACPNGLCPPALATRLAVDCYRICRTDASCYADNSFGSCYRECDQAALRLADEHRRTFEACALGEQCAPQCISQLMCDPAPLVRSVDGFEARCGALPIVTQNINRFACLGHVLQTALTACLDNAACADVSGCVETATCDTPGCLAFLEGR